MEIEIDICKCLLRNNFLQGQETNIDLQLKSALCFRLLLFFDSLHDFGDLSRFVAANNSIKINEKNLFGNAYYDMASHLAALDLDISATLTQDLHL